MKIAEKQWKIKKSERFYLAQFFLSADIFLLTV
jgi:hypothetical protein